MEKDFNKIMANHINEMINCFCTKLRKDMKNVESDMWKIVFNAYNTYQEEERDGVNYIFDITKQEDLMCCVKGGMTAQDIHWVYSCYKNRETTPYFTFGNDITFNVFEGMEAVKNTIGGYLEEILTCVFNYPFCDGYKELYDYCMSDVMEELMWN